MKETYGLQEVSNKNFEKQRPNTLKIITWISAYAVWIFIFLIPIIGIIIIIMYLLRNKQNSREIKTIR